MSATRSKPQGPAPIPPGLEYHQVLAGERRRVGRGILAILLLLVGMFVAILVFDALGRWIDGLLGTDDSGPEVRVFTPVTYATGMVSAALLIPWSMLIQRWLYGVPAASLISVVSRLRFDLFGRALLAIGPALVIALALNELLDPSRSVAWSQSDVVWMLVVTLLLMPLQSAGEEFGLRGLVFRVAASWGRGRWTSLLLGAGVSTPIFAVIHFAGDPRWVLFYVAMSLTSAFATWRTGGLEIAIVIHAVYNVLTLTFWIALHADQTQRFDRSAGSVDPTLLVPACIFFLGTAVVVWLRTRHTGPATTPTVPSRSGGS